MGRGNESTLRIDEPLHFLFLIAYFITYFCCAYLMFICFKHCRRMWRRKPCRPSRIRNVAELVNNWHASGANSGSRETSVPPRQVQVSLQSNRICSELVQDSGLETSSFSGEATTSRVSLFLSSSVPGFRLELPELLPSHDSISEDSSESPPPSYDSCVLQSLLPDNNQSAPRTTTTSETHILPA